MVVIGAWYYWPKVQMEGTDALVVVFIALKYVYISFKTRMWRSMIFVLTIDEMKICNSYAI